MTLDTTTLDKDGTTAAPLTSAAEPTTTRSIYSAVDLFAYILGDLVYDRVQVRHIGFHGAE